MTPLDVQRMAEALNAAEGSIGLTEPNPRVGCIVGLSDGSVFGMGATQRAGGAHAEVMALQAACASGHDLHGATAWVTLEPCAHHGRTPPCCNALIDAGIARCVVSHVDPNPLVAGAGIARLRAAGIQVEVLEANHALAIESRELNIGFFSRFERGRPWVRAKIACSVDGRVALTNGDSKWITGPEARADGHRWRRRASAVLTGIGTVLADDPRLDVRAVPTPFQPLRIVLDSQLRMPENASLFAPPGEVLLVTAAPAADIDIDGWRARGAEVWNDLPVSGSQPDLHAVLRQLAARRGINEVHLEAGPTLTGAMSSAGLVDEWLIYLAPMMLGPGRPAAHLTPLLQLPEAPLHRWMDCSQVGRDLRLRMRRTRYVDDLYTQA